MSTIDNNILIFTPRRKPWKVKLLHEHSDLFKEITIYATCHSNALNNAAIFLNTYGLSAVFRIGIATAVVEEK